MTRSILPLVFILLSVCFSSQPTGAAVSEWEFDQVHSNFYFTIDHTYARVRGFFEDFSGTFRFDPDKPGESRIVFSIEAKSINTNERKRDNHLRTDEFLHVSKYPEITFKSRSITRADDQTYKVTGDLTIKDVTRQVTLDLRFLGMRKNPLDPGQTIAGFESRLTLNRLDYNVGTGKFVEMGVVGEDVDILVTLEMVRRQ